MHHSEFENSWSANAKIAEIVDSDIPRTNWSEPIWRKLTWIPCKTAQNAWCRLGFSNISEFGRSTSLHIQSKKRVSGFFCLNNSHRSRIGKTFKEIISNMLKWLLSITFHSGDNSGDENGDLFWKGSLKSAQESAAIRWICSGYLFYAQARKVDLDRRNQGKTTISQ